MRFIYLLGLLLLAGCSANETYQLTCKEWQIGDNVVYIMEVYDYRYEHEEVVLDKSYRGKIELFVDQVSPTHQLTAKLYYKKHIPEEELSEIDKIAGDTLKDYHAFTVRYQLGDDGRYQKVLNLDDLEA